MEYRKMIMEIKEDARCQHDFSSFMVITKFPIKIVCVCRRCGGYRFSQKIRD